jgi:hypothetical protein
MMTWLLTIAARSTRGNFMKTEYVRKDFLATWFAG